MSQVWLYGARMGPLNDALVHIGFNSPEIFRVLLDERTGRLQAAVVGVTREFDFPTLNGSVNPADGQLYLTGFQILGWGTTATRLAGLGRVRFTGAEFTGGARSSRCSRASCCGSTSRSTRRRRPTPTTSP